MTGTLKRQKSFFYSNADEESDSDNHTTEHVSKKQAMYERTAQRNSRAETEEPVLDKSQLKKHSIELKIERDSTKEHDFVKLSALDSYLLNAFPLRDAYKETSRRVLDLVMKINGVQQGELVHYTISQNLVTAYTTVIGARRTAMHNSVREFLDTYSFFGFDFTIDAVTIPGNRNKEYYTELLEKQRFLRRGYSSNGQKFQSDALIDCIKKVMFCETSGRPRLPKTITRITREIIVLVGLAVIS
ncbi:hypothetical protein BJV82DRAFT_588341 [Fennellomyces sp. T-0311]|nr:hypothetical protein BJV82DRAFT_617128 [Fennellomyces sp. T-0311]KAI8145884.1 hypothetical protein BJV82DRAFT_602627 [Fennellomyces sp. T-0311]KAI8148723.1 hypothetical protein BJV82DRAFT_589365 [Fennellomyces sp. T-0311]KAI8149211.1 hypothetical protein BJV82DRAFT_591040 [Fennellomyces sp. T-0311]KAI8149517.1 hypothetical protein BJV82DRAFT_588341 [Fennellomyces sp. T-0311]